jgi:hypothetical protein
MLLVKAEFCGIPGFRELLNAAGYLLPDRGMANVLETRRGFPNDVVFAILEAFDDVLFGEVKVVVAGERGRPRVRVLLTVEFRPLLKNKVALFDFRLLIKIAFSIRLG